jgi:hypothetical protein
VISRLLRVFLPLCVAVASVALALHATGVAYPAVLRFAVIQLLGYVLPGTLLWRAMRGRSASLLQDATLGAILAHAVTVLVYLAGRAVGLPQVVWVLPALIIVTFLAVPSLRTYWRSAPECREPAWFTWGSAISIALLCVWFADFAPMSPLSGAPLRWQAYDYAYFLSLAGEVRNHVPPATPFVVGNSLDYHWFDFADVAAMNWQGGGPLDLLIFRLGPLWSLLNGFLAFGLLGARLVGRRSAAMVALAVAVLVGSVNLFHGADTYVVDSTLLVVNWVASPTQGFGQLISVAVLYVAVGLLRGTSRGWRPWALFGVLTVALMGAKATFIPVIGAGIALVVIIALVSRRRVPVRAVAMGVVLAAELAFAQVVLFGGASQGIAIDPGGDMRRLGASLGVPASSGTLPLVAVSAAIVLGWLAPLAGAGLLLLRPRPAEGRPGPGDPATQLLVGMVAASVVVVVLLTQEGFSEYFFLRSGLPFGYLLVTCGLYRLQELGVPRHAWRWLALSGVAGMAYVGMSRWITRTTLGDVVAARRALALVAGMMLVAALVWLAGRRIGRGRDHATRAVSGVACLALATLGMGAVRTVGLVVEAARPATPVSIPSGPSPLPAGAVTAARYVRDHSRPDDMVATNAHCTEPGTSVCDVHAFWISAYTERRILIEGWAYTAKANDTPQGRTGSGDLPFWNPPLLAENDAVFTRPSPAAIGEITERYPVRWLVVDSRFPVKLHRLQALFPDHRHFGQVWVFDVPRAA